jgi:hypothetical protein
MRTGSEGQKPVPGGWCEICHHCAPSGECLDDAIKSGHCGDWIWYLRGSKQCRRRYARPNDPKTPRQLYWRALLGAASREYSRSLTAERRAACIAAGKKLQSRPRLGLSGPLTGQLYWVRQECGGKAEEGSSTCPVELGCQIRGPKAEARKNAEIRHPKPPDRGWTARRCLRRGMRSRSTWERYRDATIAIRWQYGRREGRRVRNAGCGMGIGRNAAGTGIGGSCGGGVRHGLHAFAGTVAHVFREALPRALLRRAFML